MKKLLIFTMLVASSLIDASCSCSGLGTPDKPSPANTRPSTPETKQDSSQDKK